MKAKPQISSVVLRQIGAVEDWLPKIGRPVSCRVTHIEDGRFLFSLRLTGIPFEAQTDGVIVNMFDNLSEMFGKLGRDFGGRLAYWVTFSRRRVAFDQWYDFDSRFVRRFATRYIERFTQGDYFENTYFVTLILRYEDYDDGLKEIEGLGEQAYLSLAEYDADILETYHRAHLNGSEMQFSSVYQFLGDLINGQETEMPVVAEAGYEVIPESWLHFGYDTLESRGAAPSRRFASCFDLRGFPDETAWGQLNPLMTLPVEFTITQSFNCLTGYAANRAITSTINKLESAGDKAKHQIEELKHARGYVNSGQLTFGDYHGALIVYGETAKRADENGKLVQARSKNECNVTWMRATGSAPFTFFSQIPGAATKPRPKPQSSRNLAAMFSIHDYSAGKSKGNPLGDGSAVMPLQTVSKRLYSFNYHATREAESSVNERTAGHTTFHGTTGVGKTTAELAMLAFLTRFYPKIFGLDKGRGMEPFIRAIGGAYIHLEKGKPTGWAPFELPDTPFNREFLYGLVELCGRKGGVDSGGKPVKIELQAHEKKQCQDAVDAVMSIHDVGQRRFSLLLESIPDEGQDCLRARLSVWCKSEGGRFWWVFDNPPSAALDITRHARIAFDVEAFLVEGYDPSEPAFAYLFHLKKLMRGAGELMVTIVEEYWLPIRFQTIRDQIEETLSAGRKEGEFMVLVSQQPEQALQNEQLFSRIRSLTATKVFLPDPDAEFPAYERMGLTRKEFDEFKKLGKYSRTFLIKQGNQSAFVKLDLHGFEDEIAVLSGDRENVLILDEVRAEVGDDPDIWLPVYLERVFAARLRAQLIQRHGPDDPEWKPRLDAAVREKRAALKAIYPPAPEKATDGVFV
jgi:type IV secretion system protein VirB4